MENKLRPPIVVSPNLQKIAVKLDGKGNIISDFRSKRIVQPVSAEPLAPIEQVQAPTESPTSLQEIKAEIVRAEEHLAELKAKLKTKVEELKSELAELENV